MKKKKSNLVSCIAVVCGSRIHTEILVLSSKVDILEHLFTTLLFILCSYSRQPNRYFATRQTGIREERQLSRLGAAPDKRRHADGWTEVGGGVSDTPGERTFTCLIINAASSSAIVVHATAETRIQRGARGCTWDG